MAQGPYAGRDNLLGLINPGSSPALLLNGHVDVVPAETAMWSGDPFAPATAGGWMTGRGIGDMKGGAQTLARFIARFFTGGGLPGDPAVACLTSGRGDG